MANITNIQAQKKRPGYYNLFVDDRFFCSLSDLQLAGLDLKIGQIVTQAKLDIIKNNSDQRKVYDRALFYLQYGPRTISQMQTYLEKKGYNQNHINSVIDRLKKENYLNDNDFAQSWIRTRQSLKPRSKKMLKLELIKKGLDKKIIENALSSNDEIDEKETIKKLVDKKMKQIKYKDKQKLISFLARQGFSYADIKEVLEEISF